MSNRKRTQDSRLTTCEKKYMLDAAIGLTAKQSARKHGVSLNTVHGSLTRAKAALGADNITHAAVLALMFGCITPIEVHLKEVQSC